jgi:putative zinc finger/helix-turn-helix YgiT family protein
MKSPITGKPMTLQRETREMTFRKETFSVVFHYYRCENSGQQFTTTELDELNLTQLYNQYRSKHHIPFPDEIREIREKYGVSPTRMAQIMGFGVNVYRQYEQGEVPNHSNARLIHLARDPEEFMELVKLSDLEEKTRNKLIKHIEQLIDEAEKATAKEAFLQWLIPSFLPDEFTGYRKPSLEKATAVIRYFTQHLQPFKTKLNKLLFYADFMHFKQTAYSITGLRYSAIDMGPVPDKFQALFEYIGETTDVRILTKSISNGGIGEQFQLNGHNQRSEILTEHEKKTLNQVINKFSQLDTRQLIEKSHQETAWQANAENKGNWINYLKYGFEIGEQ